MPRQIRVRALVIRGGGNVQVARGMGRDQAVPQVNRIVINAAHVGVTRPIPPDDIAGGQAAKGGHLGGQASRQQAGTDKMRGSGFPVGYVPGVNVKSAPLLVWLASDAAGDEMRAVIPDYAGRSQRKSARRSEEQKSELQSLRQ